MKKLFSWFVLPIAVIIGGLWLAVTYYVAPKVENELNLQMDELARHSYVEILSKNYKRDTFGANSIVVLRLKPQVLERINLMVPKAVTEMLSEPITLNRRVSYLNFSDGTPYMAKVTGNIQFTPKAKEIVDKFYGPNAKDAIAIVNHLKFNGSGRLDISAAPFNYKEFSGIEINFGGSKQFFNYENSFKRYAYELEAPSLNIKLADKGDIVVKGIHYSSTNIENTPLNLGNSSLKFKEIGMKWNNELDYHVSINQFLNIFTDLQIGTLVNPTISVAPSYINISNIGFDTYLDGNSSFVNTGGHLYFDLFDFGGSSYGPLDIDIEARHLDAVSLDKLRKGMVKLSKDFEDSALSKNSKGLANAGQAQILHELKNNDWKNRILHLARDEASDIFTNDPEITIKKFNLLTPKGEINVSGNINFKGLQKENLDDFRQMMKKLNFNINYSISEELMNSILTNQLNKLFIVDETDGGHEASTKDMQKTFGLLISNTLRSFKDLGYININDGKISGDVNMSYDVLKLNGKTLQDPSKNEEINNLITDPDATEDADADDENGDEEEEETEEAVDEQAQATTSQAHEGKDATEVKTEAKPGVKSEDKPAAKTEEKSDAKAEEKAEGKEGHEGDEAKDEPNAKALIELDKKGEEEGKAEGKAETKAVDKKAEAKTETKPNDKNKAKANQKPEATKTKAAVKSAKAKAEEKDANHANKDPNLPTLKEALKEAKEPSSTKDGKATGGKTEAAKEGKDANAKPDDAKSNGEAGKEKGKDELF